MKITQDDRYHTRNDLGNSARDEERNIRQSMSARISKGSGAVVVAAGFLLLFFDGFHPLLPFVWSSVSVSVLWRFKRDEARYMDELARCVRMTDESLVHVESTAQSHEMDWHDYDAPLWEGWREGYLVVWV